MREEELRRKAEGGGFFSGQWDNKGGLARPRFLWFVFVNSVHHGHHLDFDQLLGLAQLQHRDIRRRRFVVVGGEV